MHFHWSLFIVVLVNFSWKGGKRTNVKAAGKTPSSLAKIWHHPTASTTAATTHTMRIHLWVQRASSDYYHHGNPCCSITWSHFPWSVCTTTRLPTAGLPQYRFPFTVCTWQHVDPVIWLGVPSKGQMGRYYSGESPCTDCGNWRSYTW